MADEIKFDKDERFWHPTYDALLSSLASLREERDRLLVSLAEALRVLKEYRLSYSGEHDWCGDVGMDDPPCRTCNAADALLQPPAISLPAEGDEK